MPSDTIIQEYISNFRNNLNQLDFSTIQSFEDFRVAYSALLKSNHKQLREQGLSGGIRQACFNALQKAQLSGNHRRYLWLKAGGICGLCREKIDTFNEATIDHINPYSVSHDNRLENKQIAHFACNNKKGCRMIASFVSVL